MEKTTVTSTGVTRVHLPTEKTLFIKEITSVKAPGRSIVKIEVPIGAKVFTGKKFAIRLGHEP
jgi:hypothetical protein